MHGLTRSSCTLPRLDISRLSASVPCHFPANVPMSRPSSSSLTTLLPSLFLSTEESDMTKESGSKANGKQFRYVTEQVSGFSVKVVHI